MPPRQHKFQVQLEGKNMTITETYRLIHAKAARSPIRVPFAWYWHLGLKSQDIFQASYPRSGSTWLRFMLFQILTGADPGFHSIQRTIPEIDEHRGVLPILPGGGRLIKTHERYRKEYTRGVFLVRDVRDVLLSNFARGTQFGLAQLLCKGDLDSFLEIFLKGKALQYGSWQDHTRSWLESPLAKNGNLMVVRYEDLRKNPEQILGHLLQFLGVTPDLQIIRKAIGNNSLHQMRAKEDLARQTREQSNLLSPDEKVGEEGRFVRKGSVGGWREKLTDSQLKIIDQCTGDMLSALGYESGRTEKRSSRMEVSALTV
jgi:Sulfotransferase domain